MTRRLAADDAGIAEAVQILRAGGLVAFPTETVYGLGAVATDDGAVAVLLCALGRPSVNPLIVHVQDAATAARWAELSEHAQAVAGAFWPGPLTLVLPARAGSGLSARVTAGLPSVALRVPAHPLAQALLQAVDAPLAAPSANPSGRISPTTADHVLAGLGGRIAAALDGGACAVGVESTILDLTGPPRVLRAGGVGAAALAKALGQPVAQGVAAPQPERPTAPGQFDRHYAPKARLRLGASAAGEGEVWLGFGDGLQTWSLSPEGDLAEAAARLYATLHALDAAGIAAVAVAPIPDRGLGRAINDRLARAATLEAG